MKGWPKVYALMTAGRDAGRVTSSLDVRITISTAAAECRAGRRHQGARRRSADLWLPPRPCAAAAPRQTGRAALNPKRVYRVMKVHGPLLRPHRDKGEERRHDGWVAVNRCNPPWCSDALEIGCDNVEKVRVTFGCCDRGAMEHVVTTGGITAEDVRDLTVATKEHHCGPVNRLASRSSGYPITAAPTSPATPGASRTASASFCAPLWEAAAAQWHDRGRRTHP